MGSPLKKLTDDLLGSLKPQEKLSVTDFCSRYRHISEDVSPISGIYNPDLTPHQREIQDLYTDPTVSEVVCKMASQVGKSEIIYNILFYAAINNPGPQMVLYPTKESIKEDVVKLRVNPMLASNKILAEKFNLKSKNQKNSIFLKQYEGGFWKFVGCNVPNDLAAKAIRDIFVDEHSRIVASVGNEGDPISLGRRRQSNFKGSGRTFFFTSSSPTFLGECAISAMYETSKRHVRFVPCFHCFQYQELVWEQVRFEPGSPETAYIECKFCHKEIHDEHRHEMLVRGVWRCLDPDKPRRRMGYHLSALYSSPIFYPLREIVQNYFDGLLDERKMQVFINTDLALEYEGESDGIESNTLMGRRELYECEAPEGVLYITCGIDPNGSFTAIECVGWGAAGQSWALDYREIHGAPENPETFRQVKNYLTRRSFRHAYGFKIGISAIFMDSGNWAEVVYEFVRQNEKIMSIFATKGVSGFDKPVVGKYSKRRSGREARKVKLFPIGVDGAKKLVYSHLMVDDPEKEGYCHFPLNHDGYDQKYFTELVSERLQTVNVRGRVKTQWVAASKIRNEPLDVRVLALSALKLVSPRFDQQAKKFEAYRDHMEKRVSEDLEDKDVSEIREDMKKERGTASEKRKKLRKYQRSWVRDE